MKTLNIIQALKSFGIRAAAYKRPPVASDVFAMTILPKHREGVVTINQGQAKVQVYGDKKMRQAAVTVVEPPRVVTRTVSIPRRSAREMAPKDAIALLRERFPVIMPGSVRWSVKDLVITKLQPNELERQEAVERRAEGLPVSRRWSISGTVTAMVGKTTVNHFLIGIDETRNFISPLPRKATSVKMAHRLLQPVKEMRRHAVRQGEWFFIPATRDMTKQLEKIATETANRVRSIRLGVTTHTAKSAIAIKGPAPRARMSKRTGRRIKGKPTTEIYARGYITDSRRGHHRSLFLPKWAKVVRNKEVEIKVAPQQRKAALRRRATWD